MEETKNSYKQFLEWKKSPNFKENNTGHLSDQGIGLEKMDVGKCIKGAELFGHKHLEPLFRLKG